MPQFSKLLVGAGLAAFGLLPCLAQTSTLEIDRVANWPAPLYWQQLAPSGQPDTANSRTTPGGEKPRVETAQIGETAVFVAIAPCRLVDTRANGYFPSGNFGPPTMTATQTRMFPVPSGVCSLPATAVAYSFNIAVVPAGTTMRWLTAWPFGDTQPVLATLNDKAGVVTSNAAVVAAGTNGAIDIFVEDATDIIIDVNGYYTMPANLPFAGSAATPALTFGDAETGLFSTSAGSVSIATEGSTRATVNSTGLAVTGNLDLSGMITQNGQQLLRSNPSMTDLYLGVGTSGTTAAGGGVAFGVQALAGLTTGTWNTALGALAGTQITTGGTNVAVGGQALYTTSTSSSNTAVGWYALGIDSTGGDNVAVGAGALDSNTTGWVNTAIGAAAGAKLTTGFYNIDIANEGVAGEGATIRIGDSNQTRTFISGISGVTTGLSGALPVVIDSNGQLGTTSSSRRFKTDIADMGDTTDTLMSLRPVQFRYTAYGDSAPLQYGLIAEEVAEVAPELVAHNANGEIETVFYDKVNGMLLNQVQTQQREIESQKEQLQSQREEFTALISHLESRLAELESRTK